MSLAFDLAPDLWNCRVDPTQAEVALLNVFINARDAMPEGGRLTVTTAEPRRRDRRGRPVPWRPGRYVTISVTDTGSGIPAHVLARVMDPFFTTKEEGKGTGLGLSMVYGFAKQSGGARTHRIDAGRGHRGAPVLSRRAPRIAVLDAAPSAPARQDGTGTETILIVDDREDVAELARTILRDFGYSTLMAQNGREALDILDERGPHRPPVHRPDHAGRHERHRAGPRGPRGGGRTSRCC